MGILTRDAILARIDDGSLRIDPFDPAAVGPASVDLHLDRQFRVFKKVHAVYHVTEDLEHADVTDLLEVDDYFVLMPGEAALGITRERLTLPDDLCGWLEGRSRFARVGLMIHITASFMHPGINNRQVLEMYNARPHSPSHPSRYRGLPVHLRGVRRAGPLCGPLRSSIVPLTLALARRLPRQHPLLKQFRRIQCRPECPAPVQGLPAPLRRAPAPRRARLL